MDLEFAAEFAQAAMRRTPILRREGNDYLADLICLKAGQLVSSDYTDEEIAAAVEDVKEDARQILKDELLAVRNSLRPA